MRILCCVNRDLASNFALNLLQPALRGHDVLIGVSERVGQAAGTEPEPRARSELRAAEQLLPNQLLYPLLERAGLPDSGLRHLTFAELERHRGLRLVSLPSPNSPDGLELIREFAPDLILTIRYGAILKAAAIAVPRFGVLNLHSGVLPAYRGVLAVFRALMNEDSEIGCTLHYIADGTIDTGDVVGVRRVPVDRDRSLLWHILALYPPGIALMREAVGALAAGTQLERTRQAATEGRYFSYPSAGEWQEFIRRGWRIADAADLLDAFSRYAL